MAAVVDDVVPAERAATAQAIMICLMHLLGTASSAWVVGVNRIGEGDGLTYAGDSCVVDPMGEVIADAGDEDGECRALAQKLWMHAWESDVDAMGRIVGKASGPLLEPAEVERRLDFGATVGWNPNVVGFEVDFGWSPNFFEDTAGDRNFEFGDSNVTTLMTNLLISAPPGTGLRPYLSSGLGLIRANISSGTNLFNCLIVPRQEGLAGGVGAHANAHSDELEALDPSSSRAERSDPGRAGLPRRVAPRNDTFPYVFSRYPVRKIQ